MRRLVWLCALVAVTVSGLAGAADECLSCHRSKTPGPVKAWQASAHAGGVGCADCHGSDHQKILAGLAPVGVKICGRCHEQALKEHTASRHGLGLHSGWGCTRNLPDKAGPAECAFCHEKDTARPLTTVHCARFLKQPKEIREAGCNRCHQIEASCASCHTAHGTDLKIVQDPGVCARCHMGPDHPQWEAWQTSQHGTLNASVGVATGPNCQTCHMPKGTHDVSRGITTTQANTPYPPQVARPKREQMLDQCAGCHSRSFSARELTQADAIRDHSLALVKQAKEIIEDLHDQRLLDPMPDQRPPHPLAGTGLELGAQMLYEDSSHIERLFFKMSKYDAAKAVKGAYHQNPDYLHWYGYAELKLDLVDIKAEASRLKERGRTGKPLAPSLEEKLRALKAKADRGAVSAEEYARQKARLLEVPAAQGK